MILPPHTPPQGHTKPLRPVVSSLLINKDEVLILQRSRAVGSFQGYWSCVSGYLEKGEDPKETAYREIWEETRKEASSIECTQAAGPFYSEVPEVIFESYWFLFRSKDQKITLDWEHDSYLWVSPKNIKDYKTVPWLQSMIDVFVSKDNVKGDPPPTGSATLQQG
ncbi:MAG: NUDIX domain-containing protein [Opitutales bacterium]|nr:NUDIX domain-containing protein [Opitutales bacterium]